MTRATPAPETVTLLVPFRIVKRGGRKLVISPDGRTERTRPRVNSALVKAIARAHRWQQMLESGQCGSITEIARAEKINRSYVCRLLRLTLLAPEIVESILDGRQPENATLSTLMRPVSADWRLQRTQYSDLEATS